MVKEKCFKIPTRFQADSLGQEIQIGEDNWLYAGQAVFVIMVEILVDRQECRQRAEGSSAWYQPQRLKDIHRPAGKVPL